MKKLFVISLVLAAACLITCAAAADHKVTFQNHCPYPVAVNSIIGPLTKFPAGAPAAGSDCSACQCSGRVCCPASICPNVKCDGSLSCTTGQPLPDGGGFRLLADTGSKEDSHSLVVSRGWQVSFWGRTGCSADDNNLNCDTGAALSNIDMKDKLKAGGIGSTFPATKGEIKFDGYGDQDYYDISIVDGFNLPVQIELVTGTYKKVGRSDSQYDCTIAGGGADLNVKAASELPLLTSKKNGNIIGVLSACKYSKISTGSENPAYCCLPPYLNKNCNPATWPANVNSAKLFKKYYPLAYSYAFDDAASTFTCRNNGPAKYTEYLVTFCSGNEKPRITLPGDEDHTHVPVISPVPPATPVPTLTPVPMETPLPAQTPVPSGPYNPANADQITF